MLGTEAEGCTAQMNLVAYGAFDNASLGSYARCHVARCNTHSKTASTLAKYDPMHKPSERSWGEIHDEKYLGR